MAIEKMKLLNLVGALDEENVILQEVVLLESVHLNLDHEDAYDSSYIMHEYGSMIPDSKITKEENYAECESKYQETISKVIKMSEGLGNTVQICKDNIKAYSKEKALEDLTDLEQRICPTLETIENKKKQIKEIEEIRRKLSFINKEMDFTALNGLNYFEYEIGLLSRENRLHIKRNYENISALIFEIGEMEDSREDIYVVFYLTKFKDETAKILKSLNWQQLQLPGNLEGDIEVIKKDVDAKITVLDKQITRLEKNLSENIEENFLLLNKIYTRMQLELKIITLKQQIFRGNNVFVLSAWVRECDYDCLEQCVAKATDKFVMLAKDPKELGLHIKPPTLLKNNRFSKPFEMIVGLYGLPTYHEIDPTPFVAITFCLMFGIMFGDIGQGLVYLLAGVFLSKKMEAAGGILKRLGTSSIIFGFVYGSIFGLEEVPILEDIALVNGGPLNPSNIMPILVAGVGLGVIVMTISFIIGIINCVRKKDVEGALFGKNGLAGYLFFISFIVTIVCTVGIIPISIIIPVIVMVIMLLIMVFKEPLAHLVTGDKPLIEGETSSYFVESGFEGFETLLSTLSNSISFIRVGAFALNHAGLFLAFSVMASLVPNVVLKVFIIILGNLLILTLEGLVVLIQGLRLQYYEMFSKYFGGDGIAYNPIKIENE